MLDERSLVTLPLVDRSLLKHIHFLETVTSTSLVRRRACPVVADIHLMLPALFVLLVDVTPKVFLPMATVDATGLTT